MQQDALLDDEIKDRWEMADAVKRKPDSFINEYGKMYPNFTESYRPHGYHNMVNATGLFQFIQTTLGTQRGHHDDFAWAQHFATSFPYGGNSNFFNNGIVQTPYSILIDQEVKSIVIVVRGTRSLEDLVVDLQFIPESLEKVGKICGFEGKDCFCHKGFLARCKWMYNY